MIFNSPVPPFMTVRGDGALWKYNSWHQWVLLFWGQIYFSETLYPPVTFNDITVTLCMDTKMY